jgi:hypothetical protein
MAAEVRMPDQAAVKAPSAVPLVSYVIGLGSACGIHILEK